MNKYLKVFLSFLIVIFLIITLFNTISFAIENPNDFKPTSEDAKDRKVTDKVIGKILGVVKIVGIFASVGMLGVIGIKFMLGSAEEKAQYKETLFPYLVGVLLVANTTILPSIIYNLINK